MLKKITDHIWEFGYKARLGPGISFPTRTTIIKSENKVLLYSPGPFEEEDVKEIKSWNMDIFILAPNLFHHFYFQKASELFPEARCFGPEGLEKKNKSISCSFENFDQLEKEVGGLKFHITQGADKIRELMIYHPADRALIVCDLFFNMSKKSTNLMTRMVLTMVGANGKLAQSRLVKVFVDTPDVFLESTLKVFEYHIDLLIPAHGEVSKEINSAKDILKRKFA